MPFVAPTVDGQRVRVRPADPGDLDDLADLDWQRSLHPAMGGWAPRPAGGPSPSTAVLLAPSGEEIVGAVDARDLLGYPGVVNVSMYTDATAALGGLALEGYAHCIQSVFAQGARIIHHEVLALNRPIRRLMRGLRVEPTARYRDHAFVAGRLWDVIAYSYDETHWRSILDRLPRSPLRRVDSDGRPGSANGAAQMPPTHDADGLDTVHRSD